MLGNIIQNKVSKITKSVTALFFVVAVVVF